jgi:hypothetical protein
MRDTSKTQFADHSIVQIGPNDEYRIQVFYHNLPAVSTTPNLVGRTSWICLEVMQYILYIVGESLFTSYMLSSLLSSCHQCAPSPAGWRPLPAQTPKTALLAKQEIQTALRRADSCTRVPANATAIRAATCALLRSKARLACTLCPLVRRATSANTKGVTALPLMS